MTLRSLLLRGRISENRRILGDLGLILAVSTTLTLIWFRQGLMILYGEGGFSQFNPIRAAETFGYAWSSNFGTGTVLPHTFSSLLFNELMAIAQKIQFSPVLREEISFFITLLFSGASMYYLASNVLKLKNLRFGALVSALFYMLNPYTMITIWKRLSFPQIYLLPAFPLVLAFYIKGLQDKKIIPYLLLSVLVTFLFSYGFGQPAFVITFLLTLIVYTLFYAVTNIKKQSRVVYAGKFSSIFILLFIFLNGFWLWPFMASSEEISAILSQPSNLADLTTNSRYLDLLYITRLVVSDAHPYSPTFLWSPAYASTPFLIVSFLIPAISFSAILFRPRDRSVLFFTILALVGLYLAKGEAPPLGEGFRWLFTQIPYMQVLRGPFEKTGLMIASSYSFLFGVGLTSLYAYITRDASFLRPSQRKLTEFGSA